MDLKTEMGECFEGGLLSIIISCLFLFLVNTCVHLGSLFLHECIHFLS